MKKQDSVKKVNELIKLTQDNGTNRFGVIVNRCKKDIIVVDLHNDDIEIYLSMSKLKFTTELNSFMNELIRKQKSCDETEYKAFRKHLVEIPMDRYDVYAELFGIQNMRSIIQLGDFTIYDVQRSYYDIIKKYPRIGHDVYDELSTMHINLVCTSVTARDFDKAREIAADHFQKFEHTLLFYISSHSFCSTHVRICHGAWHSKVKLLCVTDSNMQEYKSIPDSFSPYKFDSFVDDFKKASNPLLWKLITKSGSEMNHIEKRLSLAIEWFGKASIEMKLNQALLQYCIAVEALISISKGNQTQQFKENTAFIIGDTRDNRMKIVCKMGKIYDKRSKLVHGADGSSDVSLSDVNYIKTIAYKLIDRFVCFEPLCKFKSNVELITWIDNQKYSVGTD